ncbi:MAG: diaminopimelate epimerase [Thalassobaculaceae bacterium]|nr:diaminopimelate epimerase [Thalassobaculaceae bacterium]
MSTNLPFLKMHGLGNDFVVVDGRTNDAALSVAQYRAVGDRRRGVGYDQFLTILPAKNGGAAYMAIHNPDGSEAQACGNGTRCVASLLMAEAGAEEVVLETVAGGLVCRRTADGRVTCDMGAARIAWNEIPIAAATDTLTVTVAGAEAFGPATMVNIGNPHAVFFVDDVEALDLARIGPPIETNPMFPERANIEFVTPLGPDRLRMRVWERGAGITQACGSGACATVVAAVRRGVIPGRSASVILDGGALDITWRADGHVEMTGPVATSFSGILDLATLGG